MAKRIGVSVVVLLALVAGVFVATGLLVKPMGTDLSMVGNGTPTLVLAYENYSPAGGDALNRLKQVRDDYEARMQFIVADLGTPRGRAFAQRFNLADGVAVLLTGRGEPVTKLAVPADLTSLRRQLDLGLNEMGAGG